MRAGRLWLVGVVAACLWGCRPKEVPRPAEAPVPADEVWLTPEQVSQAHIEVRPVAVQRIVAPVACAGKLRFDDQRVVHVVAPISGRISRIMAPLGSHVREGEPLCAIRSAELAQTVAVAEEAHADLMTAKRAFERMQNLYAGHAAAQKDFEASRTAWVQARAEYERAQQKSALLAGNGKIEGDTYLLRAPLEGNVVANHAHPGSEVQGQYDAGANVQELFVVGDLDTVWAVADVFEMDLAQLELGNPVEVQVVAYPNETFYGKVDWVADAIDPASRSVRVHCKLDNPGHRLRPDMFVTMRILRDGGEAVTVPRTGVFRYQGQSVVFVRLPNAPTTQQPTRFVRRRVRAQEMAWGEDVPILEGLAAGEEVVAHGGIILLGE